MHAIKRERKKERGDGGREREGRQKMRKVGCDVDGLWEREMYHIGPDCLALLAAGRCVIWAKPDT